MNTLSKRSMWIQKGLRCRARCNASCATWLCHGHLFTVFTHDLLEAGPQFCLADCTMENPVLSDTCVATWLSNVHLLIESTFPSVHSVHIWSVRSGTCPPGPIETGVYSAAFGNTMPRGEIGREGRIIRQNKHWKIGKAVLHPAAAAAAAESALHKIGQKALMLRRVRDTSYAYLHRRRWILTIVSNILHECARSKPKLAPDTETAALVTGACAVVTV